MNFLRKTLKNGMKIVMEKRDLPVVAVSISNPFGAAYESSKIKGIAHFIEHLVFTGTKTRTHEDISREIEKKGGVLNAFTSNEITSYWFKLPSEHLFVGLDILQDILQNPLFDLKKFEKEKKVILEEIKMYHDNPQRYVHDLIQEALYKNPFGEGIIGSEKSVSALERDFVHDYFRKYYSPSNYIITVVGDADFDKVCAYFEKKFPINKSTLTLPPIEKQTLRKVEVREGIDQAHYIFGIHSPLPQDKDYYAFELLDAYLANGMSSRLFLKIREEKGLAYAVKGSITSEKNYSYYGIYVGTTKAALPEVEKTILEEFEAVEKMTEKDLEEAKERLIGLRKIQMEESTQVLQELTFAELASKAEDYYAHDERLKRVSLADVKRVAKFKRFGSASVVPK